MSTTSEPASLAQPRRQVQAQALWRRILKRPEAGALGGAILVFVFFWVIAPPFRQFAAFTTVLYQSATIGIPAVAVALLMIGGEFDLSAGVAVTTSSLAASMFATQVAGSLWAGVVFALLLFARDRRVERLAADPDQAAQLPRHPRHLPDASGSQHRHHQADHRQCGDRGHQRDGGLQYAARRSSPPTS